MQLKSRNKDRLNLRRKYQKSRFKFHEGNLHIWRSVSGTAYTLHSKRGRAAPYPFNTLTVARNFLVHSLTVGSECGLYCTSSCNFSTLLSLIMTLVYDSVGTPYWVFTCAVAILGCDECSANTSLTAREETKMHTMFIEDMQCSQRKNIKAFYPVSGNYNEWKGSTLSTRVDEGSR
jgi:hypothetical protein